MKKINILWADDEIDLLKPHIIFLEQKNCIVQTAYNGQDAIDLFKNKSFDIVFLDENMPGLSGLETLDKLKVIDPSLPIVMITKSEEENIMDAAIGSKIADYLIKPLNPNQILLTIKKYVYNRQLISQKTTTNYQKEFGIISQLISSAKKPDDWIYIYKKLVYWELEIGNTGGNELNEIVAMQYNEANAQFSKFIKNNYLDWFNGKSFEKPLLSPNIFNSSVFPQIEKTGKTALILIDNLRYDQWKTISPLISQYFKIKNEELYYSILPTATQYSRNSMFAGLMPHEIEKMYPEFWLYDEDKGGKNLFEEQLLTHQLKRIGKKYKFYYTKIQNNKEGHELVNKFKNVINNDLMVLVYNFVDMLSHARTDREMIRELANDEPAYRSLTFSWFEHSTLLDFLKMLSENNISVIITTDHGAIRVFNAVKIIGDKKTSTNLRYKTGKNLNYKEKEVFEIRQPEKAHLPSSNVSSRYIFATNQDFFVYPNNFNYYSNYFKNTFQHGGVSLQEMLIPLISLEPIG